MDAVSLMIGLGGLYIISNRCGSDVEDFSNKEKPSLADYPVSKKEEYEIKYVTIDGTVLDIDTNEYKNNTSNYPNVYKMAFIGCSYTCS